MRTHLGIPGVFGLVVALALAVGAIGCSAAGPSYPSKDVTLIVPWAPGGSATLSAKASSDAAQKILGKNIVLNNVAGGSGSVGTAQVSQAKPDGYTLVYASSGPFVVGPNLTNLPYNTMDLESVCRIGYSPQVLVVNADSPWKNLKEFVAAAKEKPDTITYGTSGEGATPHFAMVKLQMVSGAKLRHVPFTGSAEAAVAVAGKQVDAAMVEVANVVQHVKEGRMRALAFATPERSKFLPDVPTAREQGYDVEIVGWNGIAAPKGTPANVLQKLEEAYKKGLEDPAVVDTFDKMMYGISFMDSKTFKQEWQDELKMFGDLAKEAGLTKK